MSQPAILSDIGNVLVAFDFTIAARRCAEFSPFPPEKLLTRLDPIKVPYENGDMDDATFVSEATKLLEFQGDAALFEEIAKGFAGLSWDRECHENTNEIGLQMTKISGRI